MSNGNTICSTKPASRSDRQQVQAQVTCLHAVAGELLRQVGHRERVLVEICDPADQPAREQAVRLELAHVGELQSAGRGELLEGHAASRERGHREHPARLTRPAGGDRRRRERAPRRLATLEPGQLLAGNLFTVRLRSARFVSVLRARNRPRGARSARQRHLVVSGALRLDPTLSHQDRGGAPSTFCPRSARAGSRDAPLLTALGT